LVVSLEVVERHFDYPCWHNMVITLPCMATSIHEMSSLVLKESPEKRLLRTASEDSLPSIRRQNLLQLLSSHRNTAEAEQGLDAALVDPDPGMRLIAAREQGLEAFDVLVGLSRDPFTSPDIRIEAIAVLFEIATEERVVTVLSRTLDETNCVGAKAAAILGLVRLGIRIDVVLVRDVASEIDDESAPHLLEAMATAGDDGFEDVYLQLLERRYSTLRAKAASALGRVGTRRARAPLAAAELDRANPSTVRSAARTAIASIKQRLGGSIGSLSVVDDDAGRLALAREEGGLSIEPEPEPETSS
jgi:HEAT repeat protein